MKKMYQFGFILLFTFLSTKAIPQDVIQNCTAVCKSTDDSQYDWYYWFGSSSEESDGYDKVTNCTIVCTIPSTSSPTIPSTTPPATTTTTPATTAITPATTAATPATTAKT